MVLFNLLSYNTVMSFWFIEVLTCHTPLCCPVSVLNYHFLCDFTSPSRKDIIKIEMSFPEEEK